MRCFVTFVLCHSYVLSSAMRLLFLIRALDYGGAERQAVALAKGLKERKHAVAVAVFYSGGPLTKALDSAQIPVISLDKKGRWEMIGFMRRLLRLVKEYRPDVIHSYLTVSNILTIVLKPLFPGIKMVWGVRASNIDLSRYHWLYRLSWRTECRLSRFADRIIVNSLAGRTFAKRNGFPEAKMVVVPNGIDTNQFKPDRKAGNKLRQTWSINDNDRLIGLVARLDPMKGHSVFLEAAARLAGQYGSARFVCVGDGPAAYHDELRTLAHELGLEDRLIWAGASSDMVAVYNALDIATNSSGFGEGFSNAIGEAMACEVPCVVTDIGDSAWIVEDRRYVVPAGDPNALCSAWLKLLSDPERCIALARAARLRIEQHFSVRQLTDRTEQLFMQ